MMTANGSCIHLAGSLNLLTKCINEEMNKSSPVEERFYLAADDKSQRRAAPLQQGHEQQPIVHLLTHGNQGRCHCVTDVNADHVQGPSGPSYGVMHT